MKNLKAVGTKVHTSDPLVLVDGKLIYCSGIYFHGKLQNDCGELGGWDLFLFIDSKPAERGIYSIKVVFPDGEKNCLLFMWKGFEDRFKGLVVYSTDVESLEYAQKCFDEEAICL